MILFYGENGNYSTIEIVGVDRKLSPPLKVMYSTKLYRASHQVTKTKGYHFYSNSPFCDMTSRITTMSRSGISSIVKIFGEEYGERLETKKMRTANVKKT